MRHLCANRFKHVFICADGYAHMRHLCASRAENRSRATFTGQKTTCDACGFGGRPYYIIFYSIILYLIILDQIKLDDTTRPDPIRHDTTRHDTIRIYIYSIYLACV